jgi:DNA-binding GntR family transcriptional regulator
MEHVSPFSNAAPQAKAMERALAHLRMKIVNGDLLPGEQIRQQEMAACLGISRVPLREALNVLADQGLLLHRPHQGYFVAKRALDDLAQIYRMLELLEEELLKSIAWPTLEYLGGLRVLNDEMHKVSQLEDWAPLVGLNREFHIRIFSLSPKKFILGEVKRLWSLADLFIATKFVDSSVRLRTCLEHDEILRSLEGRDHGACIQAMRFHRESTAAGLLKIVRN